MSQYKRLIKDILKDKVKAKESLYADFSSQMYTACLRYLPKKEDADDVFQNSFLKVFEKIGQVKDPDALPGWIKMIFVNECLAFIKKESTKLFVSSKKGSGSIDIGYDNTIIEELSSRDIIEQINTLPRQYSLVFNLYVFEGLKHHEIAVKLNISEGTSKSNLHDARKLLSKKLYNMNAVNKVI